MSKHVHFYGLGYKLYITYMGQSVCFPCLHKESYLTSSLFQSNKGWLWYEHTCLPVVCYCISKTKMCTLYTYMHLNAIHVYIQEWVLWYKPLWNHHHISVTTHWALYKTIYINTYLHTYLTIYSQYTHINAKHSKVTKTSLHVGTAESVKC